MGETASATAKIRKQHFDWFLSRARIPDRVERRIDLLPEDIQVLVSTFFQQYIRRVVDRLIRKIADIPEIDQQGEVWTSSQLMLDDAEDDALERAMEQVRLERALQRDELTGLLKYAAFATQFDMARSSLNRPRMPEDECLIVARVDLDRFKIINEILGHGGGDAILTAVARVFDTLRPGDVAARVGGDEMAFLLNHVPIGHVAYAIERVHSAIASIQLPHQYQNTARHKGLMGITASFGAIVISRGTTVYFHDVDREADEATYLAKRFGRDGYVVITHRGDKREFIAKRRADDTYQEIWRGDSPPPPRPEDSTYEVMTSLQRIRETVEVRRPDALSAFDEKAAALGTIFHEAQTSAVSQR